MDSRLPEGAINGMLVDDEISSVVSKEGRNIFVKVD